MSGNTDVRKVKYYVPPPLFFEKLGDNNDFDNLMSLPLKKGDT